MSTKRHTARNFRNINNRFNSANIAPILIVTPEPTIGQAFRGGFYAGAIGVGGVATHYLVVGPVASAQSTSKKWRNTTDDDSARASSVLDGPANTAALVANGDSTVYPAAHFCNDLTIGGETDWYMPARREQEICYFNLKPTTDTNNTNSGINTNAVPSRGSNYPSGGPPTQTSAVAFQTGNSEAFTAAVYYLNSTQYASGYGSTQAFDTGAQSYAGKTSNLRVRAIRRVALPI